MVQNFICGILANPASYCENDRQPEIAMWPPKYLFLWNFDRYIYIYSVEIPKVILGFSIMTSSKKVQPNDCVSDRQPEMVMATQIGNTLIISGNMIASKFTAILGFSIMSSRNKVFPV